MSKISIFLGLFFLSFLIKAQNLVPNGDFESYSSCPTAWSQLNLAFPWYDPNNSTSDYFNACAPVSSAASVPDHTFGIWQYAHSGVGYSGFYSMESAGSNHREYIQVQLTDSLLAGCYSVSFYANLSNRIKKGTNNIGAYLSFSAITCPIDLPYGLTADILLPSNPPITDTMHWTEISGVYFAIGGEKYLTIGNFNYDSTTTTQLIYAGYPDAAYYFIDDVSIYEIKTSNAGRDTAICHGDSVMLGTTSYEGITYSWLPTAGLSNASIGNPMASPATTTTYYLTQTTPCATTVDTVVVSLGDCTVGVLEYSKENTNFKLYPNPNNGTMTLEYETKAEKVTLQIYDVAGSKVKEFEVNSKNAVMSINLSFLDAGVYYFSITENDKLVKTDKLIIIK